MLEAFVRGSSRKRSRSRGRILFVVLPQAWEIGNKFDSPRRNKSPGVFHKTLLVDRIHSHRGGWIPPPFSHSYLAVFRATLSNFALFSIS